jgi:hypothetical protein
LKSIHLIFIIPVLFFVCAALILDPGTLDSAYPDADWTPYLAAVSLARDGDLAYTREDSDRYFREYDSRPYPFRVLQKRIMNSSGQYSNYYAFHYPEVFLFLLVPFAGFLGFHGWLLLHALLILGIYVMGWLYYRGKDKDAFSPAFNSVAYFTLIPIPVLFLLPSHHLFLLAVCTAFLFCGLKRWPVISAIFLALAASSQPWFAIFSLVPLAYWQVTKGTGTENPLPRFIIAATIALFAVWGMERLMYPVGLISETRWVTTGNHPPLADIWKMLPDAHAYLWSAPEPQRLIDFLFGRNSGFLVYAFAAGALMLSSIWVLRDSLVRIAWLFVILFLALVPFIHPSSWNPQSLANDLWIILVPVPYFLIPLIRPKNLFICIAALAAFFAGPLLINPMGAITNRSDYSFSFPYKFLPVEISLAGRSGITKDPKYSQNFSEGRIYFLNDNHYSEKNYFWLRGESKLEFLLELRNSENVTMEFRNGVLENKITLKFQNSEEIVRLTTAEVRKIDLSRHLRTHTRYEGRIFVHGEIHTNAGYVPGLLSRDNPDYRFLSCQIHLNP